MKATTKNNKMVQVIPPPFVSRPIEQVMVEADQWTKYLKLKAERASVEREIKGIEETFHFPSAEEVGRDAQMVIVNGNGDAVGKLSVYWYTGATIPAAWRRRVS
jgi:hypothetical protein